MQPGISIVLRVLWLHQHQLLNCMAKDASHIDILEQPRSKYNRESGNKTLLFVGALILLVVVLSVVTLFLL